MKALLKISAKFFAGAFFIIGIYIFLNFVGAIIPAKVSSNDGDVYTKQIILVTNSIHSDIALPINDALKQRFSFLNDNGVLFHDPRVKYILFGWGAREFYTKVANWSDFSVKPAALAIIGDRSVMHIAPTGDIANDSGNIKIAISSKEYERLLDVLETNFNKNLDKIGHLEGQSYGYGDQFFAHSGTFSALNTCNSWTAHVLNEIGVVTGRWTPMVNALTFSLKWHSENRIR